MMTALVSLLTGIRVRHDVAMTGEITLRGRVLPVGGVKEKILAAKRAKIRTVILPLKNKIEAEGIPEEIKKDLEVLFADRIEEVVDKVLLQMS
jgi:ATP-dependent Lon protease